MIALAIQDDLQEIVELLNTAYRSNLGWTHEHDIITGDRIRQVQLQHQLEQSNFKLFVLKVDHQLVGCIGLTHQDEAVEIGSFAIQPEKQNLGYGAVLLKFVEQYVADMQLGLDLIMSVLNIRHELIAYYQRKGYQQTGETFPYPLDAHVGVPKVPVHLLILKKTL